MIALLEPNGFVRECLAGLLRLRGYVVYGAGDVAELERVALRGRCSLLVVEPKLGEESPAEVLRRVRRSKATATLPVFVLTEVTDRAQILEMVEVGINACLLKSQFSVQRMLARLEAARKQKPPKPVESESASREEKAESESAEEGVGMPAVHTESVLERSALERLGALKPVVSRSEVQERVNEASDLRAMSPAVNHVLSIARRPETSIESIVKAVRCDHAISLKLIRLANSSVYAATEPVSSVKDAVLRIGMEQIISVVTSVGVIDRFGPDVEGPIDQVSFWEHSIATALTASELARELKLADPEQLFTAGMLHDVGRLLMIEALGEEYAEVLRTARELELATEAVEKRMLLYSHADLMGGVMSRWSLPRDLIDPIVQHHLSIGNIRSVNPKRMPEVGALALANRLMHALEIGDTGNPTLYSTHDFCTALKVPPRLIASVEEKVPEMTDDLKLTMLSGPGLLHPMDASSPEEEEEPRILLISPASAVDSAYLLSRGMQAKLDGDPPERPRVAVVHVHQSRQAPDLLHELQRIEGVEGLEPLPTVVLSAAGNLKLVPSGGKPRTIVQVSMPVTRSLLLAHIRALSGSSAMASAA